MLAHAYVSLQGSEPEASWEDVVRPCLKQNKTKLNAC